MIIKSKELIKNLASRGDERTIVSVGKASTITLYFTYIYLILFMLYKVITTKSFDSATSDVILFVLITITFLIAQRANKEYSPSLPVSMNGKSLNIELTKTGKQKRLLQYLADSITTSFGITFLGCLFYFYTEGKNFYTKPGFLSNNISFLVLLFVVSFLINYLINERKIKKYNLYLMKSEDEDREL